MRRYVSAVAVLVALVIGGSAALVRAAEEKPAAKEKTAKKDAKPKTVRLTKPWSGIASLNDEQKTKIAEIHKKAVDDKKEIEKKETEAIMAVLTDEQKAEVKSMTEKEAGEKKMKKDGEPEKTSEAPAKKESKAG